ncbi:putative quinol monooxygenase [Nocardia sp. NPDC057227]|uniref:putative quinol monooxygenase n=1 Tax=Nocardia sp. NPDC057227 TaxID=3346056 RepID=UPI0036362064
MADSEPVVVVADLVPLPGKEDAVEAALRRAVAATHEQDAGCELYAAHRGRKGFVVIEKWSSAEDLQKHGGGAAFAALSAELDGLLAESIEVGLLQPLPAGDSELGAL